MCLTAPGRVIEVDGASALVELSGRRRHANTILEPDTAVGDWVLVAGGTILRRLDPAVAAELAIAVRIAHTTPAPEGDLDA
jgi:hydrogenase assembly chaperone HypC/HupF